MTKIHSDYVGVNSGEFLKEKQAGPSGRPPERGKGFRIPAVAALALPLMMTASGIQAQGLDTQGTSVSPSEYLYSSDSFSDRWSGFYFGASLGGGWGHSSTFYDRAGDDHPTVETNDPGGFLGSLTLGYNQQVGNNLMVGVEGDLGMMNFSAPDRLDMWDGHIWKSQYGGMWGSARLRVGYTMDNMLIYGTAGPALMQTNEVILGDNDATQNTYNNRIHTGLIFGAGIEYALSDNISAKAEYLQMQFPEYESYTNNEELYGFTNSASMVRFGVNYKF